MGSAPGIAARETRAEKTAGTSARCVAKWQPTDAALTRPGVSESETTKRDKRSHPAEYSCRLPEKRYAILLFPTKVVSRFPLILEGRRLGFDACGPPRTEAMPGPATLCAPNPQVSNAPRPERLGHSLSR